MFENFYNKFEKHEKDIINKFINDIYKKYKENKLPKLNQRLCDLRSDLQKKESSKKLLETSIFESDYLIQRNQFHKYNNPNAMLFDKVLKAEKENLKKELNGLNIEQHKLKINQCRKDIDSIEQIIEWVNYFKENMINGS